MTVFTTVVPPGREGLMMQEEDSLSTTCSNEEVVFLKKTYAKPMLKNYGHVRHLTQSTGTKNGDGGQNMML